MLGEGNLLAGETSRIHPHVSKGLQLPTYHVASSISQIASAVTRQMTAQPYENPSRLLPQGTQSLHRSPNALPRSLRWQIGVPRFHLRALRLQIGVLRCHLRVLRFQIRVPRRHLRVPRLQIGVPRRHLRMLRLQIGVPRFQTGVLRFLIRVPRRHLRVLRRHSLRLCVSALKPFSEQ